MEYGEELNNLEKEILMFLSKESTKTKKMPTLREISKAIDGKPSPTTVAKYLNIIEEKGYIKLIRKNGRLNNIILKKDLFKKTEEKRKIKNVKVSEIPLIKVKEKSNLFNQINYEELIAVPVSFGKEENLFAFKAQTDHFKEVGMPKESTIVVDKKQRLIPGDYIAKFENGELKIDKYIRGQKEDVVGKIIGSYIDITF